MNAECRCSRYSGTCCQCCRVAMELMVIALRVKDAAPEFSEAIKETAVDLQKALARDRIMKTQEVKVIG